MFKGEGGVETNFFKVIIFDAFCLVLATENSLFFILLLNNILSKEINVYHEAVVI